MALIIDTCMALWNLGFKGNIVKVGLATLLLCACVTCLLVATGLPVSSHGVIKHAIIRSLLVHPLAFRHKPEEQLHGVPVATPVVSLIVTPAVSGITRVASNVNTINSCRVADTDPQATATVQARMPHKVVAIAVKVHTKASLPAMLDLPVTPTPTEVPTVEDPNVPSTPVPAPMVTVTATAVASVGVTVTVTAIPVSTAVMTATPIIQGLLPPDPTVTPTVQLSPTAVPTSTTTPVTPSVTVTPVSAQPTAVIFPISGERPHVSYLYYQRFSTLSGSIDCLGDSLALVEPVAVKGNTISILMGSAILGTLCFYASIYVVLRRRQKKWSGC